VKRICLLIAVLFLAWFVPNGAGATTLYLQGVNFPDTISATIDFNYNPSTYEIDMLATNTSSVVSALTALAFNAPAVVTGISNLTAPNGWYAVFDRDGIGTPGQFGFFDFADITGPNFNGGSPLSGIWSPGGSFDFQLQVAGDSLGSLTTASFLNELSFLDDKVGTPVNFIARFQAIGPNDESDVAVVPIPPTAVLLGSGLLGLGILGWRRKKT